MPQFAYHLQVVGHTCLNEVLLHGVAQLFVELDAFVQVVFYLMDGTQGAFFRGGEEVGGIDAVFVVSSYHISVVAFGLFNAFYLVPCKPNAHILVVVGQSDVHSFAFHVEVSAFQFDVVAGIHAVDQTSEQGVDIDGLSYLHVDGIGCKVDRRPHAVDTRNGTDHNHILTSRQQ